VDVTSKSIKLKCFEEMPKTFPFTSIRPGQKDFLKDAVLAVSEGKHLIAQAPTGLGKTAVGLAASIESAMLEDKLILFLTSRQSQHRIVVDTLRKIREKVSRVNAVDIVSKQSMCPQPSRPRNPRAFKEYCTLMTKARACRFFNRQADFTVQKILSKIYHVQDMQVLCSREGVCPHKAALEAASRTRVLVCDYNYVFSSVGEKVLPRLNRKISELIVVIDEAHNLPDRIRSQLRGNMMPRQLLWGAKEARGQDVHLADILARFSKTLDNVLSGVHGEKRVHSSLVSDILDRVTAGISWNAEIVAEACRNIGESIVQNGKDTVLLDIASFFSDWCRSGSWIVHIASGGDEKYIGYRLLDPSVLSHGVFKDIHSSILMSGTLHPGDMYADLLGLEHDRVILKAYSSPFPPENRFVMVTPHLTTLYQKRSESMYQSIADEIANLATMVPGNIASFFPSYELLKKIAQKLKTNPLKKFLLVESQEWDKAKRDQAITRLQELKAKGGALLLGVLGGSLSEGVDYKDNLLSCVIIGGLPISPPTIEVKALHEYYSEKFGKERGYQYAYLFPAFNKILQAAGRCIRSEKDRAVVVIFDNRLTTSKYASCLPRGFDAVVSKDILGEVRTFFYGGGHGKHRDNQTRSRGSAATHNVAWAEGSGKTSIAKRVSQSTT